MTHSKTRKVMSESRTDDPMPSNVREVLAMNAIELASRVLATHADQGEPIEPGTAALLARVLSR